MRRPALAARRWPRSSPPARRRPEPPPALIEATEAASALCRDARRRRRRSSTATETRVDLNGDGRDDFVTDLARLECAGAWSAFCGSSGCPVTAWLSEPGGGHARFDFGRLLGFEHRATPRRCPALVARYAGAVLRPATAPRAAPAPGASPATRPETPPIDPRRAPRRSRRPRRRRARRAGRAAAGAGAGWTLRRVPGVEPGGARRAASATSPRSPPSASSGQPFLAVTFHERPEAESVRARLRLQPGRRSRSPPASRRPPAAPTSWRSPTARSPRASPAATARSRSASTAPPRACCRSPARPGRCAARSKGAAVRRR